jgi:hypothetical protein
LKLQRADLSDFKRFPDGEDFYDWANETYFGNRLPAMRIGFTKDVGKAYGYTLRPEGAKFPSVIGLNPKLKAWPDTLKITILHEMCHVKLMPEGNNGHGKKFKKERRRLRDAGAFDPYL